MNKVSIIVPVYHVAQYLEQCVSSLLNQTYTNIEIILVDDGGDDECPDMCRRYAQKDDRVVYVRKENGGLTSARKKGLETITGDFVMYVDGDDWLEPQTVQRTVETNIKYDADITLFGYKRVYEDVTFESSIFEGNQQFVGEEVQRLHRMLVGPVDSELAHVEKTERIVTTWGKLYRREVAYEAIFVSEREVGSAEDAIYNLGVFAVAKKCVYLDEFLYNYRKSNENSITKKYRSKLVAQWQCLYQHFERYIKENGLGQEYKIALNNRIALGMLGIGLNELESDKRFLGKSKYLRKVLKQPKWENAFKQLDFKYFPMKWKVFYSLCKYKQAELLLILLKIIRKLKTKIAH